MLLCGSDLLESFSTPGVWIPDQVEIFNFANNNKKKLLQLFYKLMMIFLVSLWFSFYINLL